MGRFKEVYYRHAKIFKVVLFLIIIVAPVIVLMLVFTPIASRKTAEDIRVQFMLPEGYTRDDFLEFVERMKREPEFHIYFYAVAKKDLGKIVEEAWQVLDKNRNAEDLKRAIGRIKKDVSAASLLFYHLTFTDDFYMNPEGFPDLNNIFREFLNEELKLTILGIYYKCNHDYNFVFDWDKENQLAGKKLLSAILEINKFKK